MSLPDSGKRTNFGTGAVRDAAEGKGLPSCIPPEAIRRLAVHFEAGSKKYAKNNWMQGIPLSRYSDSLNRHLLAASEGDDSEDHLAACLWNAACWMWTESQIKSGRLPADLDDLPFREKKTAEQFQVY